MLKSVLDWFKKEEAQDPEHTHGSATQRCVAALLVEVSLADDQVTEEEQNALPNLLTEHTGLTSQECIKLIETAKNEVDHAVSMHQFTQHINQAFELDQKLDLLCKLWSVALSDNHIDPHEDQMIRKISDLLHLRHSEFMMCKHKVLNTQSS